MSAISDDSIDISAMILFTSAGQIHHSASTALNREYDLLDFLGIAQSLKIDFLPITWQPALDTVGEGGTAEIREALVNLQMTFAFKRFKLPWSAAYETQTWSALVAEIVILAAFRHHPNVATLEGICWDIVGGERVWPVLVFEKTPCGDLGKFMSNEGIDMDFMSRLDMLLDIALAIKDLHATGVIHGDIKPENILVFSKSGGGFEARVIDFGYSTLFATDDDPITMPKSDPWTAPEHHHRQIGPAQARKMDVYSFGMLCLWLLIYNTGSNRDGEFKKDMNESLLGAAHHALQNAQGVVDQPCLDKCQVRTLFSLTLSHDPGERASDFNELLPLLCRDKPPLSRSVAKRTVTVPHEDFQIAPFFAPLFEAHFSVRYYIARCLEEKIKRQPLGHHHALNLAFCYRLGIGTSQDPSRFQSLLTDNGISLRILEGLVKQVLGDPQPPEYHEGAFKALIEKGYIPAFDVSQQYLEDKLLNEAESRNQREVEVLRCVLGEDHRIVQELRRQWSLLLMKEGRWQDAENLQLQMIKHDKKIVGEGQYLGLYATYLANTYMSQLRWKEAEELVVKVMQTRRDTLGADHPYTQRCLSKLVSIFINQERWKEAEGLGLLVMENFESALGIEHASTLAIMSDLGIIYENQGRFIEAEELQLKVMKTCERVFGEEHPRTIQSITNLTSTYRSQEQWEKAEKLDLQAMVTSKRVVGPDHPHTLHTMTGLALTYKGQARWREAERLDLETLEISKRAMGAQDIHTLENAINLSSTYRGQGRLEEAEELEAGAMEKKKIILKEFELQNPLSKFDVPHRDPDPRINIRTIVLGPMRAGKTPGVDREERWRSAAGGLCQFPNLAAVHILSRDINVTSGIEDVWSDEDREFQTHMLKTVFAALNDKISPTPKFRSLSIKGLHVDSNMEIQDCPNFKAVVPRLTELHLAISTEYIEGCREDSGRQKAQHFFLNHELLTSWLKPTSGQLTHLTLHADIYWGWIPAFDPRGLHFPKLKYLALGNYTFAHDWQIDWITSHSSTLETLVLRHCPMLSYMSHDGPPDLAATSGSHEDHTKLPSRESPEFINSGLTSREHWVSNCRWHDFFAKLLVELPILTKVIYAHGEWEHTFGGGDTLDGEDVTDGGDETLPTLGRERYINFNGIAGRWQWKEMCSEHDTMYEHFKGKDIVRNPIVEASLVTGVANERESVDSRMSDAAMSALLRDIEAIRLGFEMEDEKAFRSLLDTVARRARQKGVP